MNKPDHFDEIMKAIGEFTIEDIANFLAYYCQCDIDKLEPELFNRATVVQLLESARDLFSHGAMNYYVSLK